MATRSRGYGTNFGWLKKLCDISTCDLNPVGNPEKYGRPMKSAVVNAEPSQCNTILRIPSPTGVSSCETPATAILNEESDSVCGVCDKM